MFTDPLASTQAAASDVIEDNVAGKMEKGFDGPLSDQQRDDLIWATRYDATMSVLLAHRAVVEGRLFGTVIAGLLLIAIFQ